MVLETSIAIYHHLRRRNLSLGWSPDHSRRETPFTSACASRKPKSRIIMVSLLYSTEAEKLSDLTLTIAPSVTLCCLHKTCLYMSTDHTWKREALDSLVMPQMYVYIRCSLAD